MDFKKTFFLTLPVAFAYIPLGMALGILAASNDFSYLQILAISFFVYSGSAEFLLVSFIVNNEGLLGIFISLFLVGFRHFFYTISLLKELKALNFLRHYVIFALSDESFALLSTYKKEFNEELSKKTRSILQAFLCFLNQSYWLIGVSLGFVLQNLIKLDYSGIEFALSALFIVISIDAYKQNPNKNILLFALILGLCALLFIDKKYMLFSSLFIVVLFLLFRSKYAR